MHNNSSLHPSHNHPSHSWQDVHMKAHPTSVHIAVVAVLIKAAGERWQPSTEPTLHIYTNWLSVDDKILYFLTTLPPPRSTETFQDDTVCTARVLRGSLLLRDDKNTHCPNTIFLHCSCNTIYLCRCVNDVITIINLVSIAFSNMHICTAWGEHKVKRGLHDCMCDRLAYITMVMS